MYHFSASCAYQVPGRRCKRNLAMSLKKPRRRTTGVFKGCEIPASKRVSNVSFVGRLTRTGRLENSPPHPLVAKLRRRDFQVVFLSSLCFARSQTDRPKFPPVRAECKPPKSVAPRKTLGDTLPSRREAWTLTMELTSSILVRLWTERTRSSCSSKERKVGLKRILIRPQTFTTDPRLSSHQAFRMTRSRPRR